MMTLDSCKLAAQKWGQENSKISKAFFIGSRVKRNQTPPAESDLDIAIQLVDGFGYTDWFYESDEWSSQLQQTIEYKVHLLRGGGSLPNKVVETAVHDHGLLVFDRNPQ